MENFVRAIMQAYQKDIAKIQITANIVNKTEKLNSFKNNIKYNADQNSLKILTSYPVI